MKTKPIGGANAWHWFCSCVATVLGEGKKEQRSGAGRWSKKWSLTPFLSVYGVTQTLQSYNEIAYNKCMENCKNKQCRP